MNIRLRVGSQVVFWAGVIIILVLFAGCSKNNADPKVVSTLFWEAVISNNQEKANQLATINSKSAIESLENDAQQLQSVEVSAVEITDNKAVVETILHGITSEGEPVSFPTSTILVKEDRAWKVDASDTVNTLMANAVENMVSEMGERFSELGQQLSSALTEGMQGFSEEINKSLPKINTQLKKLKDSEKFRDLGAQLGKALADGIQQFTEELNDGLKELSKELDRNTRDAAETAKSEDEKKANEANKTE